MTSPALLSMKDACTYTALSLSSVKRLIDKNAIPVLKIGRAVRVRRADLDAWVAALPTKGGQANA